MMRLDRFLANQGLGTRKETKQLIRSAAVRVNGVIIMKEGAQIKEDSDEVTVNGETIHYQKYLYLMMNKPAGTVCANEDSLHETVFDLLPSLPKGMFTAGRLDLDTTGLLLITNDGPLAHRLLSPRRHVVKWYAVTLDAPLDAQALDRLRKGIDLGDFVSMPALIGSCEGNQMQLGIREGKYHQVKRMMKAVGREVCALHRYAFGPLTLDDLQPGEWRMLTALELHALKEESEDGDAEADRKKETRKGAERSGTA